MPHPLSPEAAGVQGIVFNIQHFTIHDGPGIRTEVFLKGCPLHCRWCSNPESQSLKPEAAIHADHCIGVDKCGFCLADCPVDGALIIEKNPESDLEDSRVTGINRDLCTRCMACADACPANAVSAWGTAVTVDQVMEEILKDRAFYDKSGGGATFSGGEALVQWEFTQNLLKACRKEKIHTCLETALHCPFEILDRVAPFADLIITDIKQMDPAIHKQYTGVDNAAILSNITRAAKTKTPLIIRIPVIPGVNNDAKNMTTSADFISSLAHPIVQLQLLPYRPLGLEKYAALGRPYPMARTAQIARLRLAEQKKELEQLVQMFLSRGIPAVLGADTTNSPTLKKEHR